MSFNLKKWQKICLVLAASFYVLMFFIAETMMILKLRERFINYRDGICI